MWKMDKRWTKDGQTMGVGKATVAVHGVLMGRKLRVQVSPHEKKLLQIWYSSHAEGIDALPVK